MLPSEKPYESTSASSVADMSDHVAELDATSMNRPTTSSRSGAVTVNGNHYDDLDHLTIEMAWDKCNLLTLDGGGIRGYWSLLALQQLMFWVAYYEHKSEPSADSSFFPEEWQESASQVPLTKDELGIKSSYGQKGVGKPNPSRRFLPCHYFDYIGGSSTGSLIAIMLGRLRMTTLDCLYEYEKLGQKVFGAPRFLWQLTLPFTNRTKYSAKQVQKVFKEVAIRRGDQRFDVTTFKSKTRTCKTFVTTIARMPNEASSSVYLIRSYDFHGPVYNPSASIRESPSQSISPGRFSNDVSGRLTNRGPAHELRIWKVARAATAARFFFDPLEVKYGRDKGIKFTDGGFGTTNNPTMEGINEIFEAEGRNKVGCVVSVGTARHNKAQESENRFIRYRLESMFNEITDPKIIDDQVERLSRQQGFSYHRLNPEKDEHLLTMGFDAWSTKFGGPQGSATISEIKSTFEKWYSDDGIAGMFRKCAKRLVKIRRLRSQDDARWKRFSLAAEYICRQTHCRKQGTGFSHIEEYRKHLEVVHELDGSDLDEEVKVSRTVFEYNSLLESDEIERRGRR